LQSQVRNFFFIFLFFPSTFSFLFPAFSNRNSLFSFLFRFILQKKKSFDEPDELLEGSIKRIVNHIERRNENVDYCGDDDAVWTDIPPPSIHVGKAKVVEEKKAEVVDMDGGGGNQKENVVLEAEQDLIYIVQKIGSAVLLLGFGSKGLYADLEEVKSRVDDLVHAMNGHFGAGKWMIVFGGDPFNEMKPDIAAVVKHIQEEHNIVVCAVQADVVRDKWGGKNKLFSYSFFFFFLSKVH
jgi:hypothetical protein